MDSPATGDGSAHPATASTMTGRSSARSRPTPKASSRASMARISSAPGGVGSGARLRVNGHMAVLLIETETEGRGSRSEPYESFQRISAQKPAGTSPSE